jgi:hypothetical protein
MIVRILGEGQYRVPDRLVEDMNAVDDRLEKAVAAKDQEAFSTELAALVDLVRKGAAVGDDELVASEAVIPDPDTTLDEARRLLSEEGLIPD